MIHSRRGHATARRRAATELCVVAHGEIEGVEYGHAATLRPATDASNTLTQSRERRPLLPPVRLRCTIGASRLAIPDRAIRLSTASPPLACPSVCDQPRWCVRRPPPRRCQCGAPVEGEASRRAASRRRISATLQDGGDEISWNTTPCNASLFAATRLSPPKRRRRTKTLTSPPSGRCKWLSLLTRRPPRSGRWPNSPRARRM